MVHVLPFSDAAGLLVDLGRWAHARGWVLGTSGNFSAVVRLEPLELAITATGADKQCLLPRQILRIDARGGTLEGMGRPSAETHLHLAIVCARGAGAVAHTHSPWGTLLSGLHQKGVALEGYEMLKGLQGVQTHEHREWLPVIENAQDWAKERPRVEAVLGDHPACHGFLIRRHGLYTWGQDVAEARRHLEVLEFLLEVAGREERRVTGC